MIKNLMKLFSTNHGQVFMYFSRFKKIQSVSSSKEGIEVSSSLKDGIQVRTIKIHSLENPTRRLLENMKNQCRKIVCLKYRV